MVVANTHTVVAETQTVVSDTYMMVADIHRNILTGQEGASGRDDPVGATRYLPTTEYLSSPRPKQGQLC